MDDLSILEYAWILYKNKIIKKTQKQYFGTLY